MIYYKIIIIGLFLSGIIYPNEDDVADLSRIVPRPSSQLACALEPSRLLEPVVPSIAENKRQAEELKAASHGSSQSIEQLYTNAPIFRTRERDYSKCDPCCNDACKPSITCVKGWTCAVTAGPPFCATALLCSALHVCCLSCMFLIDRSRTGEEPDFTKPLHFLCTPPTPEKEEERAFLHALCRMPVCWPCATFFCFPDRVMCNEFFCRNYS